MPDIIEPNIHPVFVHFAYALMTVSALTIFIVSVAPGSGWRTTLKNAGDWTLAIGALAIVATVAAGFQAYYSVAHDAPSHAAMTTHRNWAVPTTLALLALAAWRFLKRADNPGRIFSVLLLTAAGFLTVTAWWGGRLVFGYGLGVESLPKATDQGHDHEHAPGEEHGEAVAGAQSAADGQAHDHPAEDGGGDAVAPAVLSEVALQAYPSTPVAVVDAFGAALKRGDASMLSQLLATDVLIAEGGGAERSFDEYAAHHMPADMEFSKSVETMIKDRQVLEGADMTTVITTAQTHGAFRGKIMHNQSMETIVLHRDGDRWRIVHIHWSSAPIKEEHEH